MANVFDIFSKKTGRSVEVSENEQMNRFSPMTSSAGDSLQTQGVNNDGPFQNKDGAKASGNNAYGMDSRQDIQESVSPFTIPKLKRSKQDLFVDMPTESREWQQEILPLLTKYFRFPSSVAKHEFLKVSLVQNADQTQRYLEKRKEMRLHGYMERDVSDAFAFLYVDDDKQMDRICREGLATGNLASSTIGHPRMGVQLCRYMDTVRTANMLPGSTGRLIVFKIIKGRVKVVAENRTGPPLEPTPNYDSHMAKSSLDVTPASLQQLFDLYQVYLYEYGEDMTAEPYPRHVLPYAVVTFRFKEAPPSPRMPESPPIFSPKLMSPPIPKFTLSTPKEDSDPEYVIWCGNLRVKDILDCQVKMVSTASQYKPAHLGTVLNVRDTCEMKTAEERYFKELSCLRKSGEVYWKGWYINVAELRPRPDSKAQFQLLMNHLGRTNAMAVLKPENDVILLLVPNCSLTHDLGLTRPHHYPVMFHCIFISKQSSKFKSPRYMLKVLQHQPSRSSTPSKLDSGQMSPVCVKDQTTLSRPGTAPPSPFHLLSPSPGPTSQPADQYAAALGSLLPRDQVTIWTGVDQQGKSVEEEEGEESGRKIAIGGISEGKGKEGVVDHGLTVQVGSPDLLSSMFGSSFTPSASLSLATTYSRLTSAFPAFSTLGFCGAGLYPAATPLLSCHSPAALSHTVSSAPPLCLPSLTSVLSPVPTTLHPSFPHSHISLPFSSGSSLFLTPPLVSPESRSRSPETSADMSVKQPGTSCTPAPLLPETKVARPLQIPKLVLPDQQPSSRALSPMGPFSPISPAAALSPIPYSPISPAGVLYSPISPTSSLSPGLMTLPPLGPFSPISPAAITKLTSCGPYSPISPAVVSSCGGGPYSPISPAAVTKEVVSDLPVSSGHLASGLGSWPAFASSQFLSVEGAPRRGSATWTVGKLYGDSKHCTAPPPPSSQAGRGGVTGDSEEEVAATADDGRNVLSAGRSLAASPNSESSLEVQAQNLMRLHRSISTECGTADNQSLCIPLGYDEGFLSTAPTSARLDPKRLKRAFELQGKIQERVIPMDEVQCEGEGGGGEGGAAGVAAVVPTPMSLSSFERGQEDVEQDDTITSSTSHELSSLRRRSVSTEATFSPVPSPEKPPSDPEQLEVEDLRVPPVPPAPAPTPTPLLAVPRESHFRSRSLYLPPPDVPEYKPTPLYEPSRKRSRVEEGSSRQSSSSTLVSSDRVPPPPAVLNPPLLPSSAASSLYHQTSSTPMFAPPLSSSLLGLTHVRSPRDLPLPISPADSSTDKLKSPVTDSGRNISTASDMKNFLNASLERRPPVKPPAGLPRSCLACPANPRICPVHPSVLSAHCPRSHHHCSNHLATTTSNQNEGCCGAISPLAIDSQISSTHVPSIIVTIPLSRLRRPPSARPRRPSKKWLEKASSANVMDPSLHEDPCSQRAKCHVGKGAGFCAANPVQGLPAGKDHHCPPWDCQRQARLPDDRDAQTPQSFSSSSGDRLCDSSCSAYPILWSQNASATSEDTNLACNPRQEWFRKGDDFPFCNQHPPAPCHQARQHASCDNSCTQRQMVHDEGGRVFQAGPLPKRFEAGLLSGGFEAGPPLPDWCSRVDWGSAVHPGNAPSQPRSLRSPSVPLDVWELISRLQVVAEERMVEDTVSKLLACRFKEAALGGSGEGVSVIAHPPAGYDQPREGSSLLHGEACDGTSSSAGLDGPKEGSCLQHNSIVCNEASTQSNDPKESATASLRHDETFGEAQKPEGARQEMQASWYTSQPLDTSQLPAGTSAKNNASYQLKLEMCGLYCSPFDTKGADGQGLDLTTHQPGLYTQPSFLKSYQEGTDIDESEKAAPTYSDNFFKNHRPDFTSWSKYPSTAQGTSCQSSADTKPLKCVPPVVLKRQTGSKNKFIVVKDSRLSDLTQDNRSTEEQAKEKQFIKKEPDISDQLPEQRTAETDFALDERSLHQGSVTLQSLYSTPGDGPWQNSGVNDAQARMLVPGDSPSDAIKEESHGLSMAVNADAACPAGEVNSYSFGVDVYQSPAGEDQDTVDIDSIVEELDKLLSEHNSPLVEELEKLLSERNSPVTDLEVDPVLATAEHRNEPSEKSPTNVRANVTHVRLEGKSFGEGELNNEKDSNGKGLDDRNSILKQTRDKQQASSESQNSEYHTCEALGRFESQHPHVVRPCSVNLTNLMSTGITLSSRGSCKIKRHKNKELKRTGPCAEAHLQPSKNVKSKSGGDSLKSLTSKTDGAGSVSQVTIPAVINTMSMSDDRSHSSDIYCTISEPKNKKEKDCDKLRSELKSEEAMCVERTASSFVKRTSQSLHNKHQNRSTHSSSHHPKKGRSNAFEKHSKSKHQLCQQKPPTKRASSSGKIGKMLSTSTNQSKLSSASLSHSWDDVLQEMTLLSATSCTNKVPAESAPPGLSRLPKIPKRPKASDSGVLSHGRSHTHTDKPRTPVGLPSQCKPGSKGTKPERLTDVFYSLGDSCKQSSQSDALDKRRILTGSECVPGGAPSELACTDENLPKTVITNATLVRPDGYSLSEDGLNKEKNDNNRIVKAKPKLVGPNDRIDSDLPEMRQHLPTDSVSREPSPKIGNLINQAVQSVVNSIKTLDPAQTKTSENWTWKPDDVKKTSGVPCSSSGSPPLPARHNVQTKSTPDIQISRYSWRRISVSSKDCAELSKTSPDSGVQGGPEKASRPLEEHKPLSQQAPKADVRAGNQTHWTSLGTSQIQSAEDRLKGSAEGRLKDTQDRQRQGNLGKAAVLQSKPTQGCEAAPTSCLPAVNDENGISDGAVEKRIAVQAGEKNRDVIDEHGNLSSRDINSAYNSKVLNQKGLPMEMKVDHLSPIKAVKLEDTHQHTGKQPDRSGTEKQTDSQQESETGALDSVLEDESLLIRQQFTVIDEIETGPPDCALEDESLLSSEFTVVDQCGDVSNEIISFLHLSPKLRERYRKGFAKESLSHPSTSNLSKGETNENGKSFTPSAVGQSSRTTCKLLSPETFLSDFASAIVKNHENSKKIERIQKKEPASKISQQRSRSPVEPTSEKNSTSSTKSRSPSHSQKVRSRSSTPSVLGGARSKSPKSSISNRSRSPKVKKSDRSRSPSRQVSAPHSDQRKSKSREMLAPHSDQRKSQSHEMLASHSDVRKSKSRELLASYSDQRKCQSGEMLVSQSDEKKSQSRKILTSQSDQRKSKSREMLASHSDQRKSPNRAMSASTSDQRKSQSCEMLASHSDQKKSPNRATSKPQSVADQKRRESAEDDKRLPDRGRAREQVAEDRHSRQFQPYANRPSRDSERERRSGRGDWDRSSGRSTGRSDGRRPVADFDLAYKELSELLADKTLHSFGNHSSEVKKCTVQRFNSKCRQGKRFAGYRFRRSKVPTWAEFQLLAEMEGRVVLERPDSEEEDTASDMELEPEEETQRSLLADALDHVLGETGQPDQEQSGEQNSIEDLPTQSTSASSLYASEFVSDEVRGSPVQTLSMRMLPATVVSAHTESTPGSVASESNDLGPYATDSRRVVLSESIGQSCTNKPPVKPAPVKSLFQEEIRKISVVTDSRRVCDVRRCDEDESGWDIDQELDETSEPRYMAGGQGSSSQCSDPASEWRSSREKAASDASTGRDSAAPQAGGTQQKPSSEALQSQRCNASENYTTASQREEGFDCERRGVSNSAGVAGSFRFGQRQSPVLFLRKGPHTPPGSGPDSSPAAFSSDEANSLSRWVQIRQIQEFQTPSEPYSISHDTSRHESFHFNPLDWPTPICPGPRPESLCPGSSVRPVSIVPGRLVTPESFVPGPLVRSESIDTGPLVSQESFVPGPLVRPESFDTGPLARPVTIAPGPLVTPENFVSGPLVRPENIDTGPLVRPESIDVEFQTPSEPYSISYDTSRHESFHFNPLHWPTPICPGPLVRPQSFVPGPVVRPVCIVPGPLVRPESFETVPLARPVSIVPIPLIKPLSIGPDPFVRPVTIVPGPLVRPVSNAPSPLARPVSNVPGPLVSQESYVPGPWVRPVSIVPSPLVSLESFDTGTEHIQLPAQCGIIAEETVSQSVSHVDNSGLLIENDSRRVRLNLEGRGPCTPEPDSHSQPARLVSLSDHTFQHAKLDERLTSRISVADYHACKSKKLTEKLPSSVKDGGLKQEMSQSPEMENADDVKPHCLVKKTDHDPESNRVQVVNADRSSASVQHTPLSLLLSIIPPHVASHTAHSSTGTVPWMKKLSGHDEKANKTQDQDEKTSTKKSAFHDKKPLSDAETRNMTGCNNKQPYARTALHTSSATVTTPASQTGMSEIGPGGPLKQEAAVIANHNMEKLVKQLQDLIDQTAAHVSAAVADQPEPVPPRPKVDQPNTMQSHSKSNQPKPAQSRSKADKPKPVQSCSKFYQPKPGQSRSNKADQPKPALSHSKADPPKPTQSRSKADPPKPTQSHSKAAHHSGKKRIHEIRKSPWHLRYWPGRPIPLTVVQRNHDYQPHVSLMEAGGAVQVRRYGPDPRLDPDRPPFVRGGRSEQSRVLVQKEKKRLLSSLKLVKDIPLTPTAPEGRSLPRDPRQPFRSCVADLDSDTPERENSGRDPRQPSRSCVADLDCEPRQLDCNTAETNDNEENSESKSNQENSDRDPKLRMVDLDCDTAERSGKDENSDRDNDLGDDPRQERNSHYENSDRNNLCGDDPRQVRNRHDDNSDRDNLFGDGHRQDRNSHGENSNRDKLLADEELASNEMLCKSQGVELRDPCSISLGEKKKNLDEGHDKPRDSGVFAEAEQEDLDDLENRQVTKHKLPDSGVSAEMEQDLENRQVTKHKLPDSGVSAEMEQDLENGQVKRMRLDPEACTAEEQQQLDRHQRDVLNGELYSDVTQDDMTEHQSDVTWDDTTKHNDVIQDDTTEHSDDNQDDTTEHKRGAMNRELYSDVIEDDTTQHELGVKQDDTPEHIDIVQRDTTQHQHDAMNRELYSDVDQHDTLERQSDTTKRKPYIDNIQDDTTEHRAMIQDDTTEHSDVIQDDTTEHSDVIQDATMEHQRDAMNRELYSDVIQDDSLEQQHATLEDQRDAMDIEPYTDVVENDTLEQLRDTINRELISDALNRELYSDVMELETSIEESFEEASEMEKDGDTARGFSPTNATCPSPAPRPLVLPPLGEQSSAAHLHFQKTCDLVVEDISPPHPTAVDNELLLSTHHSSPKACGLVDYELSPQHPTADVSEFSLTARLSSPKAGGLVDYELSPQLPTADDNELSLSACLSSPTASGLVSYELSPQLLTADDSELSLSARLSSPPKTCGLVDYELSVSPQHPADDSEDELMVPEDGFNPEKNTPTGRPEIVLEGYFNPEEPTSTQKPEIALDDDFNPEEPTPTQKPEIVLESDFNPEETTPTQKPEIVLESDFNPEEPTPTQRPEIVLEGYFNPEEPTPTQKPEIVLEDDFNPEEPTPTRRPEIVLEDDLDPEELTSTQKPEIVLEDDLDPEEPTPTQKPEIVLEDDFNAKEPTRSHTQRPEIVLEGYFNPEEPTPTRKQKIVLEDYFYSEEPTPTRKQEIVLEGYFNPEEPTPTRKQEIVLEGLYNPEEPTPVSYDKEIVQSGLYNPEEPTPVSYDKEIVQSVQMNPSTAGHCNLANQEIPPAFQPASGLCVSASIPGCPLSTSSLAESAGEHWAGFSAEPLTVNTVPGQEEDSHNRIQTVIFPWNVQSDMPTQQIPTIVSPRSDGNEDGSQVSAEPGSALDIDCGDSSCSPFEYDSGVSHMFRPVGVVSQMTKPAGGVSHMFRPVASAPHDMANQGSGDGMSSHNLSAPHPELYGRFPVRSGGALPYASHQAHMPPHGGMAVGSLYGNDAGNSCPLDLSQSSSRYNNLTASTSYQIPPSVGHHNPYPGWTGHVPWVPSPWLTSAMMRPMGAQQGVSTHMTGPQNLPASALDQSFTPQMTGQIPMPVLQMTGQIPMPVPPVGQIPMPVPPVGQIPLPASPNPLNPNCQNSTGQNGSQCQFQ